MPSRRASAPDAMPALSEADFQKMVVGEARGFGWELQYHTWRSVHSAKGFPDLVLINPEQKRILYAECKALDPKTRKPKEPSPDQREWIDALRACGQDVRVWTELDWPEIEATLRGSDEQGRG